MKQIIILRKDLNMSPGKAAAQACHASVSAYIKVKRQKSTTAADWIEQGQTKIIVQVEDEKALLDLHKRLEGERDTRYCTVIIKDAGHTELEGQNYTALGIGPIDSDIIDPYTRKLLLYK